MKRLLCSWLSAAALSAPAVGQSLEDFAALPAVFDPQLSADGRHVAIGCRTGSRTRVCLYDLDGGETVKLFGVPEPLFQSGHFFAGPDHLLVHGWFSEVPTFYPSDAIFRLRRAMSFNIETGQAVEFMANRTDVFDNRHVISLDTDDPGSVIVQMPGPSLFRVDLESGRGRRIEQTDIASHVVRPDGTVSAHILIRSSNSTYTVRRIEGGREDIYEGAHPLYYPRFEGFDAEGGYVFTFFDDQNYGLRRMDAETGELTLLTPEIGESLVTPIRDPQAQTIVGYARYEDDLYAQTFFDPSLAADSSALAGALGAERVTLHTWSQDRDRLVLSVRPAGRPHSYYLYERSAGRVSPIGASRPQLDAVELGSVAAIRYEAADGLEIPAILTLPPGHSADDGPLPLVVMPHGGPHARDDLHFHWWRQAYASQGYAVLQPNFRGSDGFGEAFFEAGFGEFGGLMVQDLLDGADAMRRIGVAQEGPACFVGASYGGYAALMAAIRAPEDVACVVAVAPVTNPIAILGEAARFNADRTEAFWNQYIGDRFMDDEQADAISPMRRANEILAPTLLLHGDQDLVVRIEESENLIRQADATRQIELITLEGVDHGLSSAQARLRILEESARLLDATLR